MDKCQLKHAKNGSWMIQNRPEMRDIHCGGHLASLYLLLKSLGMVFAMFIEAGKNGQLLAKAWQKRVMDDLKQTRDTRQSLWRTSGNLVLAPGVTRSQFCHVHGVRQKWTCVT